MTDDRYYYNDEELEQLRQQLINGIRLTKEASDARGGIPVHPKILAWRKEQEEKNK